MRILLLPEFMGDYAMAEPIGGGRPHPNQQASHLSRSLALQLVIVVLTLPTGSSNPMHSRMSFSGTNANSMYAQANQKAALKRPEFRHHCLAASRLVSFDSRQLVARIIFCQILLISISQLLAINMP